ncbi:MAG: hypothetical protein ABGY41_01355 [Candidatus Poribacteria bacterium]
MRATLQPIAFLSVCILVIGIPVATQGQTPRSESILFVSNHEELPRGNGLYLMTPLGSQLRRFLPDISGVAAPRWSPDGSEIVLTMWSEGGGWSRVRVMDSDGGNLRLLSPNPGGSWAPTWAPDGLRVAFSERFDGMGEVFVGDTRGGNPQLVGLRIDGFNASLPSAGPTWSPDGTRIAFTAYKHNNEQSARYIWTMKPDGSDKQALVTHESLNISPAYSPDGSTIAFASDRDGPSEIYTIRADGTGLRRITATEDAHRPRWSPDGTQIVFQRGPLFGQGVREIHVIESNGRNPQRLTDFGGRAWYPDWFDPTFSVSPAMRQVLAWGWLKQLGSSR